MAISPDKNAMYIKIIIYFVVAIFYSGNVFAVNPVLEIDIGLTKEGKLLFDNTKVTFGTSSMLIHDKGDYITVISDINSMPLFVGVYDLNFIVYSDPPSEVDYVLLDEKINYKHEMYKLEIYYKGKVVYTKFLDFCNKDGKCDYNENYLSCKEDCSLGMKDNLCVNDKDGICDPDCMKNFDLDCEKKTNVWVWIFIIAIVILVGATYLMRNRFSKLIEAIERFKY